MSIQKNVMEAELINELEQYSARSAASSHIFFGGLGTQTPLLKII
jgi:hypothetical protein